MATVRLQSRRDTLANWTTHNPVLGSGEHGFETDTGYERIGDGVTAFLSLDARYGGYIVYDDYAAFKASTEGSRGVGAIWRYGPFSGAEVASGGDISNAAGTPVHLDVLAGDDGNFNCQAFGDTIDSTVVQTAIDASVGAKLVFSDVAVLIDTTIDVPSDSNVDFGVATITVAARNYGFRAQTKDNIVFSGGIWVPDASIIDATHPSGTYGQTAPIHFDNSTRCHVSDIVSMSNFYGGVNFYNTSHSSAYHNYLTDNAGGIQCLASSGQGANYNVVDVHFYDNTVLHSGDDAFSIQVVELGGLFGTIRNSSCRNNYITKDIGAQGTVGLARGIALIGGITTGVNVVEGLEVTGNSGKYMGQHFIFANGVKRSNISDNIVDGYALLGYHAYHLGETISTALGVEDITFERNKAYNNLADAVAVFCNGFVGGTIAHNHIETTIGGAGAVDLRNCSDVRILANKLDNSLAYGVLLAATVSNCDVIGNDLSGAGGLGVQDLGTSNYKDNNKGYTTKSAGTAAITSAATTTVIAHNMSNLLTTSKVKIVVQPSTTLFAATEFWIDTITATHFTINLDAVPGGADVVFFTWIAVEERA